ncbi:MAG: hypothetical protein ABF449_11630 [Ethanoligenens sp.]|uniref:hypothetical protein n=1 Tax=Ethanoligenens sp. TaxID=2099655 RepID=UPI0039EBE8E4
MDTHFFYGRYGVDPFSLFLLAVAAVILGLPFMWIVSLALIVLVVLRGFSRNTIARSREQWQFARLMRTIGHALSPVGRVLQKIFFMIARACSTLALRIKERKTNVFVHCPSCHKLLRLPKGRGKLAVTCPVCHCSFIHKT